MTAEYELIYWPLAGRGEFIRLMFEEAGVAFKETSLKDYTFSNDLKAGRSGYPGFAPPVLRKGEFQLSQTAVICKFLGREFSLYPENPEDEWHADQVNTTIHDFIAEGRLVFHARCFTESYYTQKEETKGHIEWFKKERLSKWLQMLEVTLKANNGGNGFVVGEKLTYVDLALLHVLRAAEFQFKEEFEKNEEIPLLKSFMERISARPNLEKYFKSERCRPFEGNSMM